MFKEPGGSLAAAVTNRKTARGFEITSDLAFTDFDVQNMDVGKIQQLLDGNGHDFACLWLWNSNHNILGHITAIHKEPEISLFASITLSSELYGA